MIPTTGNSVFLKDGTRYKIGPRVAEGGEGIVYEIQGKSHLLLKIYKSNKRADSEKWDMLRQKIEAFEAMHAGLSQITSDVCWIQNAVYYQHKFHGYIVPRVHGIKLSEWFTQMYNSQTMDEYAILNIARNIAKTIRALHNINIGKNEWPIIVGDLQPQNIILNEKNNHITLIDSDSFMIGGHECDVQLPTYISPERLQNPNRIRTCDEENYVLAYLFFHLFMFYGMVQPYPHKNGPSSHEECVKLGFFAYTQDPSLIDPHCVDRWNALSAGIRELFKRAFHDTHPVNNPSGQKRRPTPDEWYNVLAGLPQPGKIQRPSGPRHTGYPNTVNPAAKQNGGGAQGSATTPPPTAPPTAPATAPATSPSADNEATGCVIFIIFIAICWLISQFC